MKLYDYAMAPNPRRVRIFAAEKGMTIDTVQVDLRGGGQFEDSFQALNPACAVPMLELDDGTRITETGAICRYLEEIQPEPPLLGTDPVDKAMVEMWHRKVELQGTQAVAEAFRNTAKGFKDRAIAGPVGYAQIPALADRGQQRLGDFFDVLEARLSESTFVAGERFSIADILALVTIDFARVIKASPPDSATATAAWHEKVSARPSASA